MAKAKASPPDRIRGFSTLAEHEAATYEGKIVIADHGDHKLRRIWHDGQWWHSVVDVMGALTGSPDGRNYWKVTKKRLVDEGGNEAVTDCNQLRLPAADGKMRKTDCADTKTLYRIIQSIPAPNAEPIKQHLAQLGAERIEEIAQPSKAVDRAIQTFRDKGRDDEWIDGRLQNISARNELTDEWQKRGVPGGRMGGLTAQMGEEMLGVTPTQHRQMKQLGERDETRDHFDGLELAVVTLGERAAKTMVVAKNTTKYAETAKASMAGAKIAGDARRSIENETGRPVANGSNFLPKPDETPALPPKRGR